MKNGISSKNNQNNINLNSLNKKKNSIVSQSDQNNPFKKPILPQKYPTTKNSPERNEKNNISGESSIEKKLKKNNNE